MDASGSISDDQRSAYAMELGKICGTNQVNLDEADRSFFARDLLFDGALPIAIVSPGSADQVAGLVTYCSKNRLKLYLRGGGMSYSKAFQPEGERAIMLDFSNLTEIRKIAVLDGHVTVEAGCTWAALDEELKSCGMRSRFWGPMSGGTATIGGSMSQGSVTFGSGTCGASANAVKSFEIVTGTGEILNTGSDGSLGKGPFNRNFGPDLTGIFANDAGAMGIKTAITLEIEPRPDLVSGLSFAFDDFDAMALMFQQVSSRRLSSEMIAMDGDVARQNAGPANMVEDAKAMWLIGKAAGNPISAIGRMAKIAMAGRSFLDKAKYTAHFAIEGRDTRELNSRIAAIREFGKVGAEIVNTVPLMTRAHPFPDLPVTHPDGRSMLPIHGIFPHSALADFHADYLKLKQSYTDQMAATGVSIAEFFAGVAGIGLLYEPVFYWPDSLNAYQQRLTPSYLSDIPSFPANEAARHLVGEISEAFIALVRKHGGTHFQLGRMYPYAQDRAGPSGALLRDLKNRLDPDNIINPGALGL